MSTTTLRVPRRAGEVSVTRARARGGPNSQRTRTQSATIEMPSAGASSRSTKVTTSPVPQTSSGASRPATKVRSTPNEPPRLADDWSVWAAVDDLLNTTDLVDPQEIAAKLLDGLDVAGRALAFEQVVVTMVRVAISRARMRNVRATPLVTASTPLKTRADLMREAWRTELHRRYRGEKGWLLLGEFTLADHVYAAAVRRVRAATYTASAAWHERAAEAMRMARVARFDQLPSAILSDLLASRRPE